MSGLMPVQHSAWPQTRREEVAHLEPPAVHEGSGVDLRFILAVLRRRWIVLSAVVIGITAAAAAYAWTRTPVYVATAKIMIGVPHGTAIDLGGLVAGLPVNQERIENEMHVLQSRVLARQVIESAGLDQVPELNPALRPAEEPGWWGAAIEPHLPDPAALLEHLGLTRLFAATAEESGDAAAEEVTDPLEAVVDRYLGRLEVVPEGRSHVIRISFEAENPRIAAYAANSAAQSYLEDRLQTKLDTLRRATGWLDERLDLLRADAERKEAAVEAYRSQAGLVAGAGASLTADRITELNRELAVAKGAEAQAEARYAKAQEALAAAGGDAVPEVISSPTIQELRAREAVSAALRAELGRELGPNHPRMLEIEGQLESIRSQILVETRRIMSSLRNAYQTARSRSARLESEIASLEDQIRNRNDSEGELRVFEREAEAAQEVYRTFLMRANTGGQQEELETPEGRLISPAKIPDAPVAPRRKMLVALGFVGACFSGLALSFGLELLDGRFRNADQIRRRLRLPVLGVVPMLSSICRTRSTPQDHVVDGPDGVFGEAIRALRTSVAMSGNGRAPRVVLLTSSVQGEGKTTLCLSIGRHAAISGRKVVVVDCDLRLPRVHEGLGVVNGPGVIDFITGTGLTEVLRVEERTGLHYVSAGAWRRNAPELLSAPRMRELISVLRARYELVLIDTPPLLPVSDASVLAGLADLGLLVIGWPNARPDTVGVAATRLRAAAGKVTVGAIFNNVDVHKVNDYGFAEIDAYRGGYADYYAAA